MKFNNETIREAIYEWLSDTTSAEIKYGHISSWDTSEVTVMNNLFQDKNGFNQPIGDWDVSNVTDMSLMFSGATAFNQPIGNWDVSNVTNMHGMFYNADNFNQPIDNWDVSCVNSMRHMFEGAKAFNQPIGKWDVSNVNDMNSLFRGAKAFNQPIGKWDVSNVTDMCGLFSDVKAFNQPIENWDVRNVTNMSGMFSGAKDFNQPIGKWDVSNVTCMSYMFQIATVFNQPIGNWDVSNVTNMRDMFSGATSFNQDIGSWDVSNMFDINTMVSEAKVFYRYIDLSKKKAIKNAGNMDNRNLIKKTFYDNGNIKEQSKVNLYGEKNGESFEYHENGQLRVEVNWTNGVQDPGTIISYHNNGVKAREVILTEDWGLDGDYTEWHENGSIKTQGVYNKGVCSKEKEFEKNGKLIDYKELRFNDDQLNLAYEHWTENPEGAETKYGHISGWDTSEVSDVTDVYFEAKSINIDVSKWSLNFKRNGLLYKQTAENSFTTYHENGKIKFEYKNMTFEEWHNKGDIELNPKSKCVAYDEDGKEIEEFTVFYIPNRGDSMVIFKVDKSTPVYFKNFANKNFITDDLCNRNPHVINLTGDDEIDLEKHPPILLESERSQWILDELIDWVPNKKFVMVYRFNRPWEDSGYEDYLSLFYEPTDVAVMCHYDKIFITGEKSRDEDPGKEITEFKCDGGKSREWLEEMCMFAHDYDELRIFEEDVFYNIKESFTAIYKFNDKVHEFESKASRDRALQGDDYVEMLDIDGIKFKVAKRLNLNVDEYKKPKFI